MPGNCTTTEPAGTTSAPKWDAAPPPRNPSQPPTRNAPTTPPHKPKTLCSENPSVGPCRSYQAQSPETTERNAMNNEITNGGIGSEPDRRTLRLRAPASNPPAPT